MGSFRKAQNNVERAELRELAAKYIAAQKSGNKNEYCRVSKRMEQIEPGTTGHAYARWRDGLSADGLWPDSKEGN